MLTRFHDHLVTFEDELYMKFFEPHSLSKTKYDNRYIYRDWDHEGVKIDG